MATQVPLSQAAEQLRATTGHVRLCKTTSNLFRARQPAVNELDLSAFDQELSTNPIARTAVVGGLTTYENLAGATGTTRCRGGTVQGAGLAAS